MSLADETRFTQLKISGRLPTPRGVALELIGLTQRADASNQDIIRLISTDPALSVRVIKAANLLLGNTSRQIAGISDAVMVLGARALRQLVLGIALILDHRHGPCRQFDYEHFWVHSLLTGIAARHLVQQTRLAAPDEIFVLGLLSKIGRLALATVYSADYGALLEQAGAGNEAELHRMESARFGFNEMELSEAILADLHFPEVFQKSVRGYAQPEAGNEIEGSRNWGLLYVLHIASLMADVYLAQPAGRDKLVSRLKMQAARLAIEEEVLWQIGEASGRDWLTWSSILGMGKPEVPPFCELLQQDEGHAAQDAIPDRAGDDQALRVLLVEDDRSMRALLESMLKESGHSVLVARNGVEAMGLVEQYHPQIIITDWMMPEMDGVSLCRRLRARAEWQDIYVIVMTTNRDTDKLVEAFEAGADDYLVKPIIPKIFGARLRAGWRVVKLQEELARDREQLVRLSTDLAAANEHLQLLALTDALTSLPNRRAAMDHLEREWAAAQRDNRMLACMMVDVDHFKSINDRFGHPVGDIALKNIAFTLRQSARTQDMVCRIGGEEFLVICPATAAEEAHRCAERLRKNVEASMLPAVEPPLKVTVSIGMAVKTGGMGSPEELLSRADQNLYLAKQAGRNRTICEE